MSDKTGVVEFARGLRELGWQVIATGGTMKLLAESGVEVINICLLYTSPSPRDA